MLLGFVGPWRSITHTVEVEMSVKLHETSWTWKVFLDIRRPRSSRRVFWEVRDISLTQKTVKHVTPV